MLRQACNNPRNNKLKRISACRLILRSFNPQRNSKSSFIHPRNRRINLPKITTWLNASHDLKVDFFESLLPLLFILIEQRHLHQHLLWKRL